jgi:hypothetical protein
MATATKRSATVSGSSLLMLTLESQAYPVQNRFAASSLSVKFSFSQARRVGSLRFASSKPFAFLPSSSRP